MPKRALALLSAVLALAVSAFVTAPAELAESTAAAPLGGDPEPWLAASETRVSSSRPIIPGTEKRIRWFEGVRGRRTARSLVYLHGFSATRQEIAPVGEMIADALGANLFETRLAGHGHATGAMQDVNAEQWLADGAEALAVGAAISEEVILMGTSTGATLALAMAGHPAFERVSHLVLLSPNFAPADPNAEFLTWPGGPPLARLVAGQYRSWTPHNERQARYWSTTYPMDAAVEMMRLVKFVRGKLPMRIEPDLLVLYSPADTVINVESMLTSLGQVSASRQSLIAIERSGDPGNHVLAGNILSPGNNQAVVRHVVRFVSHADPLQPR